MSIIRTWLAIVSIGAGLISCGEWDEDTKSEYQVGEQNGKPIFEVLLRGAEEQMNPKYAPLPDRTRELNRYCPNGSTILSINYLGASGDINSTSRGGVITTYAVHHSKYRFVCH